MAGFQPFKFPDENGEEIQVEAALEGDGDEAQVEVIDDTPEKDRGRQPLQEEVADPTDEEMEAYSVGVQNRIKKLTHARHDERRKAEQLQRERDELERAVRATLEENQRLKQYVQTGEKEYTKVATSAAELEYESAKKAYKDAYESGDADMLLKAQEALNTAHYKLQTAKNFKATPLQEQTPVVQPQSTQPQPQTDEKLLNWQARNQWFRKPGYEDVTGFAYGVHQKLVSTGVDPRSDKYYELLDARIQAAFPEMFSTADVDKPKAPATSKAPATVVAPASRSSGPKKIRLTATQIALAERLGLTPQQYAVELAKLEKANA